MTTEPNNPMKPFTDMMSAASRTSPFAAGPLAGAHLFAYSGAAAAAMYGAWYGFMKGTADAMRESGFARSPLMPQALWTERGGAQGFAFRMPGLDFAAMRAPAFSAAAMPPFASVAQAFEEAIDQGKGIATFTASALSDAVDKSRDVADFAREEMRKAFEEGQEITRQAVEAGLDAADETRKVIEGGQESALKSVEQGIEAVAQARKAFEEGQEMTRRAAERVIEQAVDAQRDLAARAVELQQSMAAAASDAGEAAAATVTAAFRKLDATLESPDRPPSLGVPRGAKDDLKFISGVGPKIERTLNDLGIFHYEQIAQWTDAQVDWVNAYLKFPGRMMRDGWVEQAKALAGRSGGETRLN
jgi:predicted flap endonuclease-1-like 5' DNA nuclease